MQLNEGFDQPEQNPLPSKLKNMSQQQLYYRIPQAKPILTKEFLDPKLSKVIIKQIKIYQQYSLPLHASLLPYLPNVQKTRKVQTTKSTTLWKKFVTSLGYKCCYSKYQGDKMEQRKGRKLRLLLQKVTLGNQWLLATYIIDMAFLAQTASLNIRNLIKQNQTNGQQLQQKQEVVFDSRFEGGNLMFVFQKVQEQSKQYFLILQNDINTRGYAGWFYFMISSDSPGLIKINIVNMQKKYSFFNEGMKPLIYSIKQGNSWKAINNKCSYYQNQQEKYSTLSFSFEQTSPKDTFYIASSLPYTFSKLNIFLEKIEKKAKQRPNIYFRNQIIGSTISMNHCPLITLTWKRDRKDSKIKKKIILVIARQHPSQTVSSWVCQGFLQSLVQQSQISEQLLRRYIFKIVPMVNIDGVIYGNSRCDTTGSDCNRKWTKYHNYLYPVITAIKKLVLNIINQAQQIQYFFDLHGHSRKYGSFIYGCKAIDDVENKIFAYIMSKLNKKFVFQECRFGVSIFKKDTARGYMSQILTNYKVMTVQTSIFGYKTSTGVQPWTLNQLRGIGHDLVHCINIDTIHSSGIVNWSSIRQQIRQITQLNKLKPNEQSEGSDSNPQGDELSPIQKQGTFLNSTTISKLGLIPVKVVEKQNNKSIQIQDLQQKRKQQMALAEQYQQQKNIHDNTIKAMRSQSFQILQPIQRSKQYKSVTKIQQFKFRSLQKKSHQNKKIRIVIDIQRLQSKQPKSTSTLPVLRPKQGKQFWSALRQQYDGLIKQKKGVDLKQNNKFHLASLHTKNK